MLMSNNHNKENLYSKLKEATLDVLNENRKELLTEIAFNRNEYKSKIDNLFPQVLQNWCLVHYYTLIGRNDTKNHWSDELRGHMFTVSRYRIKGNDSFKTREKILYEIWEDNDYDIPKFLNMAIINKMLEEPNIDVDSNNYRQTIVDCIKAKQNIFNVILSRDVQTIYNYSRSI